MQAIHKKVSFDSDTNMEEHSPEENDSHIADESWSEDSEMIDSDLTPPRHPIRNSKNTTKSLAEASDFDIQAYLKPIKVINRSDHPEPITNMVTRSRSRIACHYAQVLGSSRFQKSHTIMFGDISEDGKFKGWLEDIHLRPISQSQGVWEVKLERPVSLLDSKRTPTQWQTALEKQANFLGADWTRSMDKLYLMDKLLVLSEAGGYEEIMGYAFMGLHKPEYQKE